MALDLILENLHIAGAAGPVSIGIEGERIAVIAPRIAADAPREDAGGALAFPGFVESHIHLDKACILDRCRICEGTLAEAVRETARAKKDFTPQDVYQRAARVLEKAIVNGTNLMRTFVEVDPRVGLRAFEAILQLKQDYAFAVDLDICVFAQEGLTQEMATFGMLESCLRNGATMVGGCPYTDPDPARHVALVFDLAERFGTAVDFHLDFDLDPRNSAIPIVLRETEARGFGGRVSIGHVTKLSAVARPELERVAAELAGAGIALTVLPATDLFLMGRGSDRLVPRGMAPANLLRDCGVVTSVATNNVLNPFTPYGDASLGRMANLFANIAQLSRNAELDAAFAMVAEDAARLLGRGDIALSENGAADIVLIDAPDRASAIREVAPALAGWKRGRKTFCRPRARLLRP